MAGSEGRGDGLLRRLMLSDKCRLSMPRLELEGDGLGVCRGATLADDGEADAAAAGVGRARAWKMEKLAGAAASLAVGDR